MSGVEGDQSSVRGEQATCNHCGERWKVLSSRRRATSTETKVNFWRWVM